MMYYLSWDLFQSDEQTDAERSQTMNTLVAQTGRHRLTVRSTNRAIYSPCIWIRIVFYMRHEVYGDHARLKQWIQVTFGG